jgi:acetolactate synthase-1/2/3 large subunit/5-guanidino-2-oxopentanoate decarboxylase
MTQRPLGAQISHMLKDRGVDVIFGIPGVHNQEMYRGIEEAGLRHVLARHEQGAGFMADGYARATGKPGVAYVITGPGLCNIMTPMGQAYSDSVPMLVISSCLDETASKRGQLHQMKDQEAAARTVCDWSETARTAEAAYGLIDRAFTEYQISRERPKHISVPIEQLEAVAEKPQTRGPIGCYDLRPPQQQGVERFIDRLKSAKKPLFIFGGGATGGTFAIREILKKVPAASFTTYAGRGIVADNPLHFGSSLARPDSAEVFKEADYVVLAGTDMSEVDLWRDEAGYECDTHIINVDPELLAIQVGKHDCTRVDCGAFFRAVNDKLESFKGATDWSVAEVAKRRDKWRMQIEAERPGILAVADALKKALPEDTRIFSDMTQFAYAANEVYPLSHPRLWHHPSGFGTLGYALPAAIGGKIGVGEKPVIAILGDYGFQYTVQELAVAVELELTLPIIIWDNGKLGEIEDSMVRAQIAPNAVIQRHPELCKLAEAYGAGAARPTDLASFQQAITDALAAKGPTIIHVKSDIAT